MQKSFLECACKTPRHKRTPRDKRAEPEKNTPPQTYISRKSQIFLRDFFRENSRFFVIFCIFCEITPPQAYDFAKVRFESANSGFPTPMISQNLPTCPMAIHPSKVGCKPHHAKVGALGGADAKRGLAKKKRRWARRRWRRRRARSASATASAAFSDRR